MRDLDQAISRVLDGTDGAGQPFFSPDGESVAFFAGGKLKTLAVTGGTPVTVCDAVSPRGGAWAPDGTIIFSPSPASPLMRVAARGGDPRPATTLDAARGEASHRWPQVLPGGRAMLFAAGPPVTATGWTEAHVVAQSFATGERHVIADRASYAQYVPGGYVVLLTGRALVARRFDADRLETSGAAMPVVAGAVRGGAGATQFGVASNGTAVFQSRTPTEPRPLVWVDRTGRAAPMSIAPAVYSFPRFSPDGALLAVNRADPDADIWTLNVERGTSTRVTSDGRESVALWTPDGSRLVFTSTRTGLAELHSKRADGSGAEETLTNTPNLHVPGSWAPGMAGLSFTEVNRTTGADIWLLPPGRDAQPRPLLQTRFNENQPAFSPNGKWLAYTSDESGRIETYLQPFPETGDRWQVSMSGGLEPLWARSGRELFFRRDNEVWVVDVAEASKPPIGRPRILFTGPYEGPGATIPNYAVAPDGGFVMVSADAPPKAVLDVILNWTTEWPRRVQ